MNIAVTAASGKLGSSIIRHLILKIGSKQMIGVARTPEKAKHLGIEIRKGDYNNPEDLAIAFEGVDVVMLLSGMDEPQKRIELHRHVIAAAKANGVKKIVYTSIIGDENNNAFSPIVQSNRQTELDIRNSGLDWVIGRNGIYIEPDLKYLETYVKEEEIRNCAGDGKCTYTSRDELACAYANMLLDNKHNGETYNLVGDPITQNQLAQYMNTVYNTNLVYNSVSVNAYLEERKKALGDFLGTVIAGIYEGIRNGANDVPSDFEKACGRPHKSTLELIEAFK